MPSDLVSVIIPTFRRGDLLTRAVQSVLAQDYAHIEVIVVDDGSGESLDEVLPFDDSRLRVIQLPVNSGSPAEPRNVGVAAAVGEWIAFLDDDDTWCADKLQTQLDAAISTGAQALSSNALRVSRGQSIDPPDYFNEMPPEVSSTDLVRRNYVITSTLLVRRSTLLRVLPFPAIDIQAYEDLAVWLRLATICPILIQSLVLAQYRDEPATSLRSMYPPHDRALRNTFDDYRRWCSSTGHSLSIGQRWLMRYQELRARVR